MGKPSIRNCHEDKPEQEAGFKGGHQPSTREHPKCRVGNAERKPWPRYDSREAVRLTGQWRDRSERFHLFINHAGRHIELLFAFVESRFYTGKEGQQPSDSNRTRARLFRMGGDVDDLDRELYLLYAHHPSGPTSGKDLRCGQLRYSKGGKRLELELELEGLDGDSEVLEVLEKLDKIKHATADRIGTEPNLFENHLVQPSVPEQVRTMLWFPLTPTQAAALPTFLLTKVDITLDPNNFKVDPEGTRFRYKRLVERYFEIQTDEGLIPGLTAQQRQWLTNIASALDRLVQKARSEVTNIPASQGGIDGHQIDWWRLATLEALDSQTLTLDPGHPRTLLTLTQAILDGVPNSPSLENFKNSLGLVPKSGGHTYEAEITLVDANATKDLGKVLGKLGKAGKQALEKATKKIKRRLPFGAVAGTLVVKKPSDGPFEAKYVVAFGGLKIAMSKGSSAAVVQSTGKAEFVYGQAWRPENIPGPAFWSDTAASAYGGGRGAAKGMSFLCCKGGGKSAPRGWLNFDFSGVAKILAPGFGGGISGMGLFGSVVAVESEGGDLKIDLPDDHTPFEYKVSSETLHFPINGAALTENGVQLVEIFAACELAVLSRPGVRLELHGYADQPDKELSNLILSRNRAMSVYNVLKNILEDEMPTPELGNVPGEAEDRRMAEELASKERQQKGKDAQIDYVITDPSDAAGRVAIRAHGEVGEGEGYDSSARRVEVYVNGVVKLSLRRKRDN